MLEKFLVEAMMLMIRLGAVMETDIEDKTLLEDILRNPICVTYITLISIGILYILV